MFKSEEDKESRVYYSHCIVRRSAIIIHVP